MSPKLTAQLTSYAHAIYDMVLNHPILTVVTIIGGCIAVSFFTWLSRFLYIGHVKNVYLKITLPREDSPRDKEKDTEKDFREKIGIMEQCFRGLNEIKELNIMNIIRRILFHDDVVSFELVVEKKLITFYVVTVAYYTSIIEKQITALYPAAEVEPVEPYRMVPEGNVARCFYAHQKKDWFYPIKTHKQMEVDPLNVISNAFSKMEEGQTGIFQIMVRPVGSEYGKKAEEEASHMFQGRKKNSFLGFFKIFSWVGDGLMMLIHGADKMAKEKTDTDYERGYVRMLQTKEETYKRMGEKGSQTNFRCVIRLIATAPTEQQVESIMNNMIVAFNVFNDEGANGFDTRRVVPIDFINNPIMLYNAQHRILETRWGGFGEQSCVLSEEELGTMYHFPNSKYNQTPSIVWLPYKKLTCPPEMPTEGMFLGYNTYRGFKREIHFLDRDRGRHHYLLGKSGTGKSSFLSWMIRQDIQSGKGVAVIDPHGDLVEDVINYIPKERAKDVIIFDPSDQDRPMGLNILEAKTPEQQDLVSSQATEIFIKLFGDEIFGPRIQHYFRNACLTLMEDQEEGATLLDVPRIFVDNEFMKYRVAKAKNPVVRSFWEHEYAQTGERERQEMIPYFSAKFGPFITNTIMRNTIGQTKSAFDFRDVMDSGKILLVKLSKGKIGELNTQLLGLIIVARLQMAAMSRTDTPEDKRREFFLYVDEFQSFATESFASILSEARKYRLTLIMAHQYISQLVTNKFGATSTQIRDAVFGNVGSMSIFKIGAEDAEYLAKEFAPDVTEQDFVGISNYKAYMKMNINGTTSRPFTLDTVYNKDGANQKVGEIIKEYSRLKYGRKRDFVEQEIVARIGIDVNEPAKLPDIEKTGMGAGETPAAEPAPAPTEPVAATPTEPVATPTTNP